MIVTFSVKLIWFINSFIQDNAIGSKLSIKRTRILLKKAESVVVNHHMDRLWRLAASLQNQKRKIQSNIFENIFFEAADH